MTCIILSMQAILNSLVGNLFFWILVAGALGGYLSLRAAGRFRDRAAFAESPQQSTRLLFWARLLYGLFAVFMLTLVAGFAIVAFQLLEVVRPSATPSAETSTPTPAVTDAPAPTATLRTMTATPAPTTPVGPSPTPTQAALLPAHIGNTNFLGVNVRVIPSLEGDILAKLRNGTPVTIIEGATEVADGFTWQSVVLEDGRQGWIAADFLIVLEP